MVNHLKLRLTALTIGSLFVLIGIIAAGPVSAKSGVVLKSDISVDAKSVRLGDLFGDIGEAAHIVVTPAPAPGQTVRLAAWSVQRLALQNGVAWNNAFNIETIDVTRNSRILAYNDLKDRLKDALSGEIHSGELELSLHQKNLIIHLPTDLKAAPPVQLVDLNRQNGRFEFHMDIPEAGLMVLTGQVFEVMPVPVLRRPIERGEIIAEADLDWIRLRIDRIGANLITDPNALVAKAAKRPLRSGQPVRTTEIHRPIAVKKGALVTMRFDVPGMSLSDTGRALDQGSIGDQIAILNPRSHRTVYGTVVGPDQVTLSNTQRALEQSAALQHFTHNR